MKHEPLFDRHRRRFLLGGLAACCAAPIAFAGAQPAGGAHVPADMGRHDHAHHQALPKGIKRSEAMYPMPQILMVRQDGANVTFPKELDSGVPVLLDFIYTSCTSICPVTSQIFREFQARIGKDSHKVRMISISIDPEYDTPGRLREYARKYDAGPGWQHYTGTSEASVAIQRAFDVYRGDKMNHSPVTFLRGAPGKPWVRVEGFASPDVLLAEYRNLSQ